MNDLQMFAYEGKEIRTIFKDGETWFVLKDVCDVLEISNSRMVADRLDEDEKADVSITDTSSNGVCQNRQVNIINESGLYNVILLSRKPEAKQFKRWITHDVLPSIRKTGMYATSEALKNPRLLIDALIALEAEQAKTAQLEAKVEADQPKVLFADSVSTSKDSILIGNLAKLIKQNGVDIGQNRLFKYLRQNGYLCSQGDMYNMPTQRALEAGWFEVKERTVNNPDGSVRITRTTMVSGKGQIYFVNLFLNKQVAV